MESQKVIREVRRAILDILPYKLSKSILKTHNSHKQTDKEWAFLQSQTLLHAQLQLRKRMTYLRSLGITLRPFLDSHFITSVAIYGVGELAELCFYEVEQAAGVPVYHFVRNHDSRSRFLGKQTILATDMGEQQRPSAIIIADEQLTYMENIELQRMISVQYGIPTFDFAQILALNLSFEHNLQCLTKITTPNVHKIIIPHYTIGAYEGIHADNLVHSQS